MATVAKITTSGGDNMCPKCRAEGVFVELEAYKQDFYVDGVVISLRFKRCMTCNLIKDVDAKFTLPTVH